MFFLQKNYKHPKRGFALVATLTLMMLVGLIAVGILSMISTQNRMAAQAVVQIAARQQALMGLDAAIAELQIALGPDQRVTASSGILSENESASQHILGVWDSWEHNLYSRSQKNIRTTYSRGRSSMFRRWLISSQQSDEVSSFEGYTKLGTRKPGLRILLLGAGTLGSESPESEHIYADIIRMPASGNNEGCFAWWIGGENQKANIGIKEREAATSVHDILNRTWDTPAPSFEYSEKYPELANLSKNAEADTYDKLITNRTLSLITENTKSGQPWFYDATLYSYSLPLNVRDGGLKYDLNLLLNKKTLKGTPFAPRTNQDCPLADNDDIPKGTEDNMPIGSWQVMHSWYNMWPRGNDSGSGEFRARLQGSVTNAYTRMSGQLIEGATAKGDSVTYYDNRSMTDSDTAGYARTPILTTFLGEFGLHVESRPNGLWLGSVYSPVVQWWNPYNVEMRVGAKKLWIYSLPYRTMAVQYFNGAQGYQSWQGDLMYKQDMGINDRNVFGNDWGNYFLNKESDDSDIRFAPGEILVFSMASGAGKLGDGAAGEKPQPLAMEFIVGDHPGSRNNYFKGDFTGKTQAELEQRRYWTRIRFEKPGTYSGNYVNQSHWLVTMGEVLISNAAYTASEHAILPGRPAFSVVHGFDGIQDAIRNSSTDQATVDSFSSVRGISPATFTLGWYDDNTMDADDMLFLHETRDSFYWTMDMLTNSSTPNYFKAVGIAPKSFNSTFYNSFPKFKGKDYRSKIWQHSCPAFGGSAIYNPSEQERQYHPYHLVSITMEPGLSRSALDVINGRNGVWGLFGSGSGGGEDVSFISVLELPIHPPFSLAGFAGMRLTPGWYDKKGNVESIARMRRMQYQAGVPGVGIGNSFADPCLPPADVYAFHANQFPTDSSSSHEAFSDFYDHALLINDALWDTWFCSSVSDIPAKGGTKTADQVLNDFMNDTRPLPVSRYKKSALVLDKNKAVQDIMDDNGWMKIAQYLMIEGGFNINSVSEEAWVATLMGLAKRDLLSNASGALEKIDKKSDEALFSRFAVATSRRSLDSLGSYDPIRGSSSLRPSLKAATAWGELRSLNADDIRLLAREIIRQVRERGPFLNMSDFINRRLDDGNDTALKGALQAAIDNTNINKMFNDNAYEVNVQKSGNLYSYLKAAEGSMYTAAPGYLIQSDVLAALGNILTVRDDTFVVRAYGCIRNQQKVILAQAWCEATMQRTFEYMDSTNSPEDSDRADSLTGNRKDGKKLTEINKVMGRKFRMVSFRWLDAWDI